MFCSAMKNSRPLSGYSLKNCSVIVEFLTSPSSTTTFLFSFPRLASALPKASLVLEKGNSLALNSLSKYDARLFTPSCLVKRFQDVFNLVPFNNKHFKAKSLELLPVLVKLVAMHCLLRLSKAINIHNSAQVVELVISSAVSSLPYRALCYFSVAKKNINPARILVKLLCQGHANSCAH